MVLFLDQPNNFSDDFLPIFDFYLTHQIIILHVDVIQIEEESAQKGLILLRNM